MLIKRAALCSLLLSLIASLLIGCAAAPAPKQYTIGIISLLPAMEDIVTSYKSSLAAKGYKEGENVRFIYSGATNAADKLDSVAKELVAAKVDLIVAITTPGAQAAQRATSSIPIVFIAVTDPVASGIVADLTQPGKNITGILAGAKASTSEAQRLEWFTKIAPNAKRLYVPYNPNDPVGTSNTRVLQAAAPQFKLTLVTAEVRTLEAVIKDAENLPTDIQGIFLPSDPLIGQAITTYIQSALKQKLPASTTNITGAELGALMSYGSEFKAMGAQAARLTSQILNGTAPAQLPVEVPELLLALNLKTAEQIGLELPDPILRAAQIIFR